MLDRQLLAEDIFLAYRIRNRSSGEPMPIFCAETDAAPSSALFIRVNLIYGLLLLADLFQRAVDIFRLDGSGRSRAGAATVND